jgi:hypothetical protein
VGVVVKQISVSGGGVVPITRFSDSFNRLDQPLLLGVNWYSILTSRSLQIGQTFAANVNCAGTEAGFGTLPSNVNTMRAMFIPAPLSWAQLTNRTQFSQVKYNSRTGAGGLARIGPAVFLQANDENGYIANIRSELGDITIQRGVDIQTVLAGPFALAVGDVIRINCTPSPSSNSVSLFLNDVLQATFVDNAGARPLFGMPGIGWTGTQFEITGFQNYVGGAGLL